MIDYPQMKTLLALLLVLSLAHCEICSEPQRSFYMSFPTLSKRDTIQNIFDLIGENMTVMENDFTDSTLQSNFHLTNIHPRPFYNDHEQKDSFIDKYTCNVTMGVVSMASFFDYTISHDGKNQTGKFRVRGALDPSYITKKLILTEGYLEWKPEHVPAYTFSQDFYFEYASPNVTDAEKNVILAMMNNKAGNRRVKDQAIIEINTKFGPMLTDRLNHEQLISSNNITYKYKNITIQLDNFAKDFELSNDDTKGLEVFLIFGLDNSTENCTKLPTAFDEDQYGGLQELYTFSTVRSIIKEALRQGLFDVKVDKFWQVPGFQFYMGDLGNFVPFANTLPASDEFVVNCKFDSSRMENELKISRYDEHQIYLGIPEVCLVNYQGKDVIQIDMDITLVARLFGERESISVEVESAGVYDFKPTILDSNYLINNNYTATYAISEVLNGLTNQPSFGTDFPIIRRNLPVVRVLDDSLIIFDPSEY